MTDKTDYLDGLRRALEVFDADPVKGDMARESFGEECDPDTISALLAERDALKEDAERYRELRAMNWWDSPLAVVAHPKRELNAGAYCPSGDLLDEAINAARSAEGTRNEV